MREGERESWSISERKGDSGEDGGGGGGWWRLKRRGCFVVEAA